MRRNTTGPFSVCFTFPAITGAVLNVLSRTPTATGHFPMTICEQKLAGIPRKLGRLVKHHTLAIEVWSHESYVAHRAKHASREAFEQALAEVLDAPPLPGGQ